MQVLILCPDSEESETLNGQVLDVDVLSLRETVGALKQRLAGTLAPSSACAHVCCLAFLSDVLCLRLQQAAACSSCCGHGIVRLPPSSSSAGE